MAKSDPEKVAAQMEDMQQEIKNLQLALGELVDALITEAKPDFSEIKKLQTLKKKALTLGEEAVEEAPKPVKATKAKAKRRKTAKKPNVPV